MFVCVLGAVAQWSYLCIRRPISIPSQSHELDHVLEQDKIDTLSVSPPKAINRPFYSCVLRYLAMNASEAGGDLALIETSLLFSCK